MSTLEQKQVKCQKQHLKFLWDWGADGLRVKVRHIGPRAQD